MSKMFLIIRNEEGSLIVGAIMVLLLLTIIGISASNTSITEVQMSTNSLLYERTFYTAESGLDHIIELLKVPFVAQNTVALASGTLPNWNFALAGATGVDYENGVEWISSDLDGVTYTVRVWNDDDDGNPATSPTNDTNGKIFVRSVAVGPWGSICQIETLIDGTSVAQAITGYAQIGAGSEKNFISDDVEAIDFGPGNFVQQI